MMSLEVINAIVAELADPDYTGRIHGQHSAYGMGCQGILCRKYNRDKVRANYRRKHPVVKRARGVANPELEELLARVIAQHMREVLAERADTLERELLSSVS